MSNREVSNNQACDARCADEYRVRLRTIERHIELLNKVLDNHSKQGGLHWGHVGDLSMIDNRLADMLDRLAGMLDSFAAELKA